MKRAIEDKSNAALICKDLPPNIFVEAIILHKSCQYFNGFPNSSKTVKLHKETCLSDAIPPPPPDPLHICTIESFARSARQFCLKVVLIPKQLDCFAWTISHLTPILNKLPAQQLWLLSPSLPSCPDLRFLRMSHTYRYVMAPQGPKQAGKHSDTIRLSH